MVKFRCPNPLCASTEEFQIIKEHIKSKWRYVSGNGEELDESRRYESEELHAFDMRCLKCECEQDIGSFLVSGNMEDINI